MNEKEDKKKTQVYQVAIKIAGYVNEMRGDDVSSKCHSVVLTLLIRM